MYRKFVESVENLPQASGTLRQDDIAILRIAADVDLGTGETKLCRDTDGLASTTHEDFGFFELGHFIVLVISHAI